MIHDVETRAVATMVPRPAPVLGLRSATFVLLATLAVHAVVLGVDAKVETFTVLDASNATVVFPCLPQTFQDNAPFGEQEILRVIEPETNCTKVAAYEYFSSATLEDIEGKIAVVQASACSTTWRDHLNEYLQMLTQLHDAHAKGVVYAERFPYKMPGESYANALVQSMLSPTCVVMKASFDSLVSLAFDPSRHANLTGLLEANMSTMDFTRGNLQAGYASIIRQGDTSILGKITLEHDNGNALPIPATYADFGPAQVPKLEAGIVEVELVDACLNRTYSECAGCWSVPWDETVANGEALQGKVGLVKFYHLSIDKRHACFQDMQEFAVVLQAAGASGVLIQEYSTDHDHRRPFTTTEVTIPTFYVHSTYKESVYHFVSDADGPKVAFPPVEGATTDPFVAPVDDPDPFPLAFWNVEKGFFDAKGTQEQPHYFEW